MNVLVCNFLQYTTAASLLGSKIFLAVLLLIPLGLCFLLHVRYLSFQHKTTDNITVLCILICVFREQAGIKKILNSTKIAEFNLTSVSSF